MKFKLTRKLAVILCVIYFGLGIAMGFLLGMRSKKMTFLGAYKMGFYDAAPRKACSDIHKLDIMAKQTYNDFVK
jgi:hypothetical protein